VSNVQQISASQVAPDMVYEVDGSGNLWQHVGIGSAGRDALFDTDVLQVAAGGGMNGEPLCYSLHTNGDVYQIHGYQSPYKDLVDTGETQIAASWSEADVLYDVDGWGYVWRHQGTDPTVGWSYVDYQY
jgi:hypothetical protein